MGTTDTAIRTAKAKDKGYKIQDEKSMYIYVSEAGGKTFRLDYRYANKRKTYVIGSYPEISLKEAREKRDEARKLISEGIDPNELKKAKKYNIYCEASNRFKDVATEWHAVNKPKWIESHAQRKWRALEKNIFPYIGDRPVKNITAQELLSVLRLIEERGSIDVAHRTKNIVGEVYSFAIATGRAERNISHDLKGALTARVSKNMATITETDEIGGLMRAIDSYTGDIVTKCALRLTPYVMLRPGELRQAEWSEIDLHAGLWKIPAEKMKMRRPHIIPLSKQAVSILKEIQPLTGQWKYVFPNARSKERPMSNVTILSALRRMGYTKEEMTAHGFRAMASTLLHEKGYESAIIEMQLAHVERNKVKGAYNHAEYLDKRTVMMQEWADYLDGLKLNKP
ncbi:tyrosine-type recombinase/integrase [Seleniivibrio sp.]|uniref:tyrosine-type recombinase/integrase n=1 Tax=Seleniivibrio sp. TaxID=2898801 RepID=UPI0025FA2382|nr:tyrosine-type recombinase/integrase [Seleniivibrio sp.]MCD8554129.1 tyrosine-type recombinase/integrase [Seleniivibrio sp.]